MKLMPIALFIAGISLLSEDKIKVTPLTDAIYMLTTDQGSYTTNSLLFNGEDGILLVDTQSEEYANELKEKVLAYGKGLPKYIINTHRHVEHVGGNAIFGDTPVTIAHHLVREKLKSGSYLFEEFPDTTLPDVGIDGSMSLFFNGEEIVLRNISGSHDDNEISVHFTKSKVIHISSIVNGFTFPSTDSDGDVLAYHTVISRAKEFIPKDAQIVSGHGKVGSYDQIDPYLDMIRTTTNLVRQAVAEGQSLEEVQKNLELEPWKKFAASYVSADQWLEYLFKAMTEKKQNLKSIYEVLYHVLKKEGPKKAIETYNSLKMNQADQYDFSEWDLTVIGSKLMKKEQYQQALLFLKGSLKNTPSGTYTYYTHYLMASCLMKLNQLEKALKHCERGLLLQPESKTLSNLRDDIQAKMK